MKLTVQYMAQLRTAVGQASEEVILETGSTAADLLRCLAEAHGPPLSALLLDSDGRPQPTVLVFVGDEQIDAMRSAMLNDRDEVTLLTPIAGG